MAGTAEYSGEAPPGALFPCYPPGMLVAAFCCVLLCSPQGRVEPAATRPMAAVTPKLGRWCAWLRSPGGNLLFEMRLSRKQGAWRLTLINGPERIHYDEVRVKDGVLRVRLAPYDSHIEARVQGAGDRLVGSWTKTRGGGKRTRMVFEAKVGKRPRGSPVPPGIPGRWAVQFAKAEHPAVGIFQAGKGGAVNGTFLTTLGDYRFLSGTFGKELLSLSCFDGAHAFLFHARVQEDSSLQGDFWSSDTWHEKWTARRDANARLPDAFALTRWNGAVKLGDLAYPDLDGKKRALTDAAFRGKARILLVFGTWCPNCNDASRYLTELDKRYREHGLRIVGLAFEHAAEFEKSAPLVRAYVDRQRIHYPVLVAGISDKAAATRAFPALDRVRAYPTTIFLDRHGEVRAVHTGFAGPATGDAHRRLRQRFEAILEELLGDR
ncbi:MAG: TlpA family protein disulfide reductase [Planctomycetota bacterium]